jgi:hypothetical protein
LVNFSFIVVNFSFYSFYFFSFPFLGFVFLVLFFRKSVSAFKFEGMLQAIPSPTSFLISLV